MEITTSDDYSIDCLQYHQESASITNISLILRTRTGNPGEPGGPTGPDGPKIP